MKILPSIAIGQKMAARFHVSRTPSPYPAAISATEGFDAEFVVEVLVWVCCR